ncbi:hypothetical protein [Mycolicibacterium fortuitum]|uniref:hypothetical protein n=1 Tax=Mycolicibacterium fortuitum TaxID=1766 RepID=UPI003AB04D08
MTSETPAQRLGRLVRARRKSLKLTQAGIQARGGPSTATQRLIEGGKHTDFRGGTGSALESALQWATGSIDDTLAGGSPTPIGEQGDFGPYPVLDHEVRFSSTAFVQELADIWYAWRDLGLRLVAGADINDSRQAHRALSLTASVIQNLVTLAGPNADSSELRADIANTMKKLFNTTEKEGDQGDVETEASAGTSSKTQQGQEVNLSNDAQGRSATVGDLLFGAQPPADSVEQGEDGRDVAGGQ